MERDAGKAERDAEECAIVRGGRDARIVSMEPHTVARFLKARALRAPLDGDFAADALGANEYLVDSTAFPIA